MSITHVDRRFVEAVNEERKRQDEKWGVQRLPWPNWIAVLGEEFGECCQATLQFVYHDSTLAGLSLLRDELIQVAAVCAAIVEHIDERAVEVMEREVAAEEMP